MRMNERENLKKTKTVNLSVKLAILLALFAVLIFTFSFAIFGDSLNFSSVASANEAESTIESGSSNVSGSSGGETASGVETGGAEAEPAHDNNGSTINIIEANATMPNSGAERNITGVSLSGHLKAENGSYWSDKKMQKFDGNANGDVFTVDVKEGFGETTVIVAFNLKIKNTNMAYALANGAKLRASVGATFTQRSKRDLEKFGVHVGKNAAPNQLTKADALKDEGKYRIVEKKLGNEGDTVTIPDELASNVDPNFLIEGWDTNSATVGNGENDGAIGLVVSFYMYQSSNGLREIYGEISSVKLTLQVVFDDNQAPKNTTVVSSNGPDLQPYRTSLNDQNLPYKEYLNTEYNNNLTGYTELDFENDTLFTGINENVLGSLDSGANKDANIEELKLTSYTAKVLGNIGGGNYYKKVKFQISDDQSIETIKLSTTGPSTEVVEFKPYKHHANRSGWIKADGKNVYYYEYKKNSKEVFELTLYFAQNVTLNIATADYASGSGASTKIEVKGIDTSTAAELKNSLAIDEVDNGDAFYATSKEKLADVQWIYKATERARLTITGDNSSAKAPNIYHYRLYYSTSSGGSYSELKKSGNYKYAAGKVFAFGNANGLSFDFNAIKALSDACYGSGFYRVDFTVANLAGTNSDGAQKNSYFFKVDYDNDQNASTISATLGDSNVSGDFTHYLVGCAGFSNGYWIGTKDMDGSAYPYYKLQIELKNATRKGLGTDGINLYDTVGQYLSGNSLKYTNVLGEESTVVVKGKAVEGGAVVEGGAISASDSVGGTVGYYDLSRFGLGNSVWAYFDGNFYVTYSYGVFSIYYGGTSDSAIDSDCEFVVIRGDYDKEQTKATGDVDDTLKTTCYFKMDFKLMGQVELGDEGGYLANGTGLTNATGSSRQWYTENWKPQITSKVEVEGEEHLKDSYTYFGIKRNAVLGSDSFGENTPNTWYLSAIIPNDYNLNYVSRENYYEYLKNLKVDNQNVFDAILVGSAAVTADSIIPYAQDTMADFSMGKQNVAGLFTIYAWTVDQAGNVGKPTVAQIFIDGNRYTIASYLDKDTVTEFISADCLSSANLAIEMKNGEGEATTEFRRGDTVTFSIKWAQGFVPHIIATADYMGGSHQYNETSKKELYKADGENALQAKYLQNIGLLSQRGINVGETFLADGVLNCDFTWNVDSTGLIVDNNDFLFDEETNKTEPTAYVFSFRRLASLTRASASIYYNGESDRSHMPYTGAITDENYERWADGYTFANDNTHFGVNLKYYVFDSSLNGNYSGQVSYDKIKNVGKYFVYAQVDDNCYVSNVYKGEFAINKPQEKVVVQAVPVTTTYGGKQYKTVFGFKISGLLGDDLTPIAAEVVGSESDYIAKVDGVYYRYVDIVNLQKYTTTDGGVTFTQNDGGRYVNLGGEFKNLDSDFEYYNIAGLSGEIGLQGMLT
ncbi:MAG: hypothetical protein SPD42_01050 [Eubacteriales bacterium]|nr:hypothetical protein [Eubacteriales bacterium]